MNNKLENTNELILNKGTNKMNENNLNEELVESHVDENMSMDEIDKKRKKYNDIKKKMVIDKQIEIIDNIRHLQKERTYLQQISLEDRTSEQYDRIAELNVEIANELSKIQIQYQYQSLLFEKAKEFYLLLRKIKSDSRVLFDMMGLPISKLEEYFSDNANNRWYINHQFWTKWSELKDEYYPILSKPEVMKSLKQIDMRCMEFEKNVGLSPTQFSNLYNFQLKTGMSKTNAAREEAILRNLRLVMAIASKIRRMKSQLLNSLEYDDLYMEGILGLITGVEKFEYQRKNKLSTYATWWVVQKINRRIEETRHIIKSGSQKDIYKSIAIITYQYETRHCRQPTKRYIILKHLLNEYIVLKKGIKNVLPKTFIEEHLEKVQIDTENYLNNDWSDIDSNRISVLNILKKQLIRENSKAKGGRKPKNDNAVTSKKKNKVVFEENKRQKIVINKDELTWLYMLDLYEELYDIESFSQLDFFKKQLDIENPKSKVNKLNNVFFYLQPVVSLENEVGDEDNNTYRDTIKADQLSIEEEVMEKQRQIKMIDIIKKYLKPKEAEVLALLFGLDMQLEQDFHVIAQHLGVSVERIRQIMNGAMKKLKTVPEMQELLHTLKHGEL